MPKHEILETPEYKRQPEDISVHEVGFSALGIPHEGFVTQSNSERGIIAPEKAKRLGRHARKASRQSSEADLAKGFIKGADGNPDKLIVNQNDNFRAPYDIN